MQKFEAAQTALAAAQEAAAGKRKALSLVQEQAACLALRGTGDGQSAAPKAADVKAAMKRVQEAAAAAEQAAKEEQRLEKELRTAKVKAVEERPEAFLPKEPELPAGPIFPAAAEKAAAAAPALPPSHIGLIFPGQGSQYVNMLKGLAELPEVQAMVASAKEVLGWDPLQICLNGPEDSLEETSICQPCMFLGGMAGLVQLRRTRAEAAERPQAVAGLSLGEYTALCAAGVFTFEEGMQLVKLRGEAMAEAAQSKPQAMLSVFGIELEPLQELCRAQAVGHEVCEVANHLFPRGYSCAGTTAAIQKLKEEVEKAGAMQAKLLKTSGGFHTELMRPAQQQLQAALDALLPKMKAPSCDVFMNVTGKKIKAGTPPAEFAPLLAKQLCSPVLWESCVRGMIEDGVLEFFEVGPMKQLKAMMKRIDMDRWSATTNIEV